MSYSSGHEKCKWHLVVLDQDAMHHVGVVFLIFVQLCTWTTHDDLPVSHASGASAHQNHVASLKWS